MGMEADYNWDQRNNLPDFSDEIAEYTNHYFSGGDLNYIFEHHDYIKPSDLKQLYMNCRMFIDEHIFHKIVQAMMIYPDQNFRSIRSQQFKSKMNLIENLSWFIEYGDSILIVGSWHGILALMLINQGYGNGHCVDIDPEANEVAEYLGINSSTQDMFDVDYNDYKVIINTSCEHVDFEKWFELIPAGKIVGLQSTNMPHKEHTNIVESLDDFKNRCKMSIVQTDQFDITGQDLKKYKRFTIIGAT